MNSPFPWPGGKRNLKKTLLQRVPAHAIYVEVFCGSAKLLFAKEPSPCEVLNDLNGDLANFFRVAKHRGAELAELFDHEIVHAERFKQLKTEAVSICSVHIGMAANDEMQRALRFAYLVWYSYGAKGQHFAASSAKDKLANNLRMRRPLDDVRGMLDATAARLRKVLIEQRDFAEILVRYDSPRTFFYLDPPYVHFSSVGQYGALGVDRREQLFGLLASRQAAWLMSFDDCEEVRGLSRRHGFHVEAVEATYSLSHTPGSRSKRGEVLISPA